MLLIKQEVVLLAWTL